MKPAIPTYVMNTEAAPARGPVVAIALILIFCFIGYMIYKNKTNDKKNS